MSSPAMHITGGSAVIDPADDPCEVLQVCLPCLPRYLVIISSIEVPRLTADPIVNTYARTKSA
jgi:hypothetical protein